eukprot:TRINITY_DN3670_c0_g2_i1.p1 TRINITY_DN3670_c0_g2~~TRINITY_DN3670_c0_g2_i1.p1  ORF type:complete len:721 (+),score=271.93 TRINITY_DN3670_c0_g2_i1:69-2231(+)
MSSVQMMRFAVAAGVTASAMAGNPKDSNAVSKVVEMLEGLSAKVDAEGTAEKKTYDKYARWCSETEEEKQGEINLGKDTITELTATIATGEADTQAQTDAISGQGGFEQTISELEATIASDIKQRKKDKAAYEAANKETEKAIEGLDKAVEAMRASQPEVFLQTAVREQLHSAAELADAMGLAGKAALRALAAPTQDYNFHSDGIIATLEKLQADFRDADRSADEEEGKAISSFTASQIALKAALAKNNRNLETAKQAKGAAIAKTGQAKKDLEETKAELASDEKYKAELIDMCNTKKKTFDQRAATRKGELEALDEATAIIKDSTGKAAAGSALLFEVAAKAANTPAVLRTAEIEAETIERQEKHHPASFLQTDEAKHVLKTVRSLRGKGIDRRQQAFDLLMNLAEQTHKGRFVAFAQKAAKFSANADVFAEIKKMIADQIESLKNKAAESQSKKASCDKRISESSVKRDNANKAVKDFNNKMMTSEARRDELSEDIKRLKSEMETLAEEVKSATDARNQESAENAADVEEAEIALSGIDAAMKVIKDFYGANAENVVASSLLSVHQPAADAPDASFKNNEAYKGSQEASTGIVGMLQVIQSDFSRTISDTKAAEKAAGKEHTKFLGEADISTNEKKTASDTKKKFLSETIEQLDSEESSLNTQIGILKSAVGELAALDEECGSQISYEERKAARAEEILALQGAIEHINSFIMAQGLR